MKTNARLLAIPLALSAILFGCEGRVSGPAATTRGPVFARGGGDQMVMVQFKKPASAMLQGFFAQVATLDFASDAQSVPLGRASTGTLETKLATFPLTVEPQAEFYDGKTTDPEICETGWLNAILDEANQRNLSPELKIFVGWDQPVPNQILVEFRYKLSDGYEYQILVPVGNPAQDKFVDASSDPIILAARDGNFRIKRREIGKKGTWYEMQTCNAVADDAGRRNGLMDFEVWVSLSQ